MLSILDNFALSLFPETFTLTTANIGKEAVFDEATRVAKSVVVFGRDKKNLILTVHNLTPL